MERGFLLSFELVMSSPCGHSADNNGSRHCFLWELFSHYYWWWLQWCCWGHWSPGQATPPFRMCEAFCYWPFLKGLQLDACACICSLDVVVFSRCLVRFKVRSVYRSVPVYVVFLLRSWNRLKRCVDLYYFLSKRKLRKCVSLYFI